MLFVAAALLVVMGATALVLDRLWLDSAQAELSTAAEAAAVAAAGRLADDHTLTDREIPEQTLQQARQSAQLAASSNLVAGRPVTLDTRPHHDVRFGRLVTNLETGRTRFLETDSAPRSVVVTAHKNRRRNNPVALLFQRLVRRAAANVVARAEASLDNHIVGLRPVGRVPVPALPIAIMRQSGANGTPGWQQQIVDGQGADQYAFKSAAGQVLRQADGIPEIVLHSQPSGTASAQANFVLLGFNRGFRFRPLNRQIRSGLSATDLRTDGGQLTWDRRQVELPGCVMVNHSLLAAFQSIIGQRRICLLYDSVETANHNGRCQTRCSELVAVRILSAVARTGNAIELVAQPTVITTRTAILLDEVAGHSASPVPANRYIYKLRLTH